MTSTSRISLVIVIIVVSSYHGRASRAADVDGKDVSQHSINIRKKLPKLRVAFYIICSLSAACCVAYFFFWRVFDGALCTNIIKQLEVMSTATRRGPWLFDNVPRVC